MEEQESTNCGLHTKFSIFLKVFYVLDFIKIFFFFNSAKNLNFYQFLVIDLKSY